MSEAGPQVNGLASPTGKYIDHIDPDDPEYIKNLQRPAEVKEDLQQMENRSRVKVILNSQAFKDELEQVVEEQLRDGPFPSSLIALQQITDLLLPHSKGLGSLARASAVIPINDLRGVESQGFAKGERLLRCKLAALYRLVDLRGWSHGIHNYISARVSSESEHFLLNPFGLTYAEVTASSLVKVDVNGDVVDPGSTSLGLYKAGFLVHASIHQARPDIKCIVHLHTPAAVAVSALKCGLLPMSHEALLCGNISYHDFQGISIDSEEREKLARNLGVHNKVLVLRNRGILACGETVEEAFHYTLNVMAACDAQVKAIPLGLDNIVIPSEEAREQAHRVATGQGGGAADAKERKWKTGELEFEALMRALDNSGYRTGYAYKMPVVKQERKDRSNSDVQIPPSSSSFTYIFDGDYIHSKYASPIQAAKERQKNAYRAGWLTTPNTYKKTEIEEIGTTTPKKITKWVSEGDSPNRPSGTPVKIDNPNQFAPQGVNPKEYKEKQKSIKKDYYEERVTAGPQSKILEGLTWDEAQKVKDGQMSMSGDQLIVVGAASKGIIQRDHQHNAVVYRQYYAANPFENMSEAEIEQYQAEVQRKERGEPAFEEEVQEPSFEAPTSQQQPPEPEPEPEPERQDTEVVEQTRPERDTNGLPETFTPSHSPTGHQAPLEEKLLAGMVDKMVQTIPCDIPSIEQHDQGLQRLAGADPLLIQPHFNHPNDDQIIYDHSNYKNQISNNNNTQSVSENSSSDEEICDENVQFPNQNSSKVYIDELINSENCMWSSSLERERASTHEMRWHEAGTCNSEDDLVTVQLNPIQLYHGRSESGVMKVRFSIQSTVRRRVRAELSRGGDVEDVYASVSEPFIEHYQSEVGGGDDFEHSDAFMGHTAYINQLNIRRNIRRAKPVTVYNEQQSRVPVKSLSNSDGKRNIDSRIPEIDSMGCIDPGHSMLGIFPNTMHKIGDDHDGRVNNSSFMKPDIYDIGSLMNTGEIIRLNKRHDEKGKQTPNLIPTSREEGRRSGEQVRDASSGNKTVTYDKPVSDSGTAENSSATNSCGPGRSEEACDQVTASLSDLFSAGHNEDDLMYADEELDEDSEPVKEHPKEKLKPTEAKTGFQQGNVKKRVVLDRKLMPPPPLPPSLTPKNFKSKKKSLRKKIPHTYPLLSPVKEEFGGTTEEMEEMEAILEEVDDSFEQLLISAEDDLLVSPKTDHEPGGRRLNFTDFFGAAPMASEDDFDFELTHSVPTHNVRPRLPDGMITQGRVEQNYPSVANSDESLDMSHRRSRQDFIEVKQVISLTDDATGFSSDNMKERYSMEKAGGDNESDAEISKGVQCRKPANPHPLKDTSSVAPVSYCEVTPPPGSYHEVTPPPVSYHEVTPTPVSYYEVTPPVVSYHEVTPPLVSYSKITLPPVSYHEVRPPPVSYHEVTPPPVSYSKITLPPVFYDEDTPPPPVSYHEVTPPPVSYSKVTPLLVSYNKATTPPVSYHEVTPPAVPCHEATPPPVSYSKATPRPVSYHEVTPPPVSYHEVTPPPVSYHEVTPPPVSYHEVTPPPVSYHEVTPPPVSNHEVTPPPVPYHEATPPPVSYSKATPPPVPYHEVTPPPVPYHEVTPPSGAHHEVTPPPVSYSKATPLLVSYNKATPPPVSYYEVTPPPVSYYEVTRPPVAFHKVTRPPVAYHKVTPPPGAHHEVTPPPVSYSKATPPPVPYHEVTPPPVPYHEVIPPSGAHHEVTPPPVPYHEVTPPPVPYHEVTPPPVPYHEVTPPPVPYHEVTPPPVSYSKATLPPVSYSKATPPPVSYHEVTPPPVSYHEVTPPPVSYHEVTPPPVSYHEVTPPPVSYYEVTPPPVSYHEVTPPPVPYHEVTPPPVPYHEVTPPPVSYSKATLPPVSYSKATPPPVPYHEATPPPVSYSKATPPPVPYHEVTPPPVPYHEVTPPSGAHHEVTPPPVSYSKATPLLVSYNKATPPPVSYYEVTPPPVSYYEVTRPPVAFHKVTRPPVAYHKVTPPPGAHHEVTPPPVSYSKATPPPVPYHEVTPPPVPYHEVIPPSGAHHEVTPPPVPYHEVTPPPVPYHEVTPPPVPYHEVTPPPVSYSKATLPPVSYSKATPPPVSYHEVTPPPVSYHEVTPPPVSYHEVTPPPVSYHEVTPPPVSYYEVTPPPVSYHEVTPPPVPYHEVTPPPVPYHEVTPPPVSYSKATLPPVSYSKATPPPVSYHEVTPPPVSYHEVTPPPVSYHEVTPPPVSYYEVTPPPVSYYEVTPPPVSYYEVTRPPVAFHKVTRPLVAFHKVTRPPVAYHKVTPPPVTYHEVTPPPVTYHEVTQPPVTYYEVTPTPETRYSIDSVCNETQKETDRAITAIVVELTNNVNIVQANQFGTAEEIPQSEMSGLNVDCFIPSREKESSKADAGLGKEEIEDSEARTRKTATNSDLIAKKIFETNQWYKPRKAVDTSGDNVIICKKTEENNNDDDVLLEKVETNVDIITSSKTETNVDDITSKKLETNIDDIFTSKKRETNIDDIFTSKKTETNVDDIISMNTETNIDDITSKKTETYLDDITSKKTETNLDNITSKKTETNLDNITFKKTETDIDDIFTSKNIIFQRKTETNIDVVFTKKPDLDVNKSFPVLTLTDNDDISEWGPVKETIGTIQHKNVLNIDEGPVQTSSPKMGRARSKESPFRPYLQKLGKSEEILIDIMPLRSQKSQIAAKSQEEMEDSSDEGSVKLPLSRSKSLGPHHVNRKKQKQAAFPVQAKSKETLIDDYLDSGRDSVRSQKVVLDEHNLMNHCEMMKLSSAKSIFKASVKMTSPVIGDVLPPLPDTTEVPSVSDTEEQPHTKDFNQPPPLSRILANREDQVVVHNVGSMDSLVPKQKWVPKPKRERRRRGNKGEESGNNLQSRHVMDEIGQDSRRSVGNDSLSEKSTRQQIQNREPFNSKVDTRSPDEVGTRSPDKMVDMRSRKNGEVEQTDTNFDTSRRNEEHVKDWEDDLVHDYEKLRMEKDYDLSGMKYRDDRRNASNRENIRGRTNEQGRNNDRKNSEKEVRKKFFEVDKSLNSSIVEDVTIDLGILPANEQKVKNVDKNIEEKARSEEDFYKKDQSIKEINGRDDNGREKRYKYSKESEQAGADVETSFDVRPFQINYDKSTDQRKYDRSTDKGTRVKNKYLLSLPNKSEDSDKVIEELKDKIEDRKSRFAEDINRQEWTEGMSPRMEEMPSVFIGRSDPLLESTSGGLSERKLGHEHEQQEVIVGKEQSNKDVQFLAERNEDLFRDTTRRREDGGTRRDKREETVRDEREDMRRHQREDAIRNRREEARRNESEDKRRYKREEARRDERKDTKLDEGEEARRDERKDTKWIEREEARRDERGNTRDKRREARRDEREDARRDERKEARRDKREDTRRDKREGTGRIKNTTNMREEAKKDDIEEARKDEREEARRDERKEVRRDTRRDKREDTRRIKDTTTDKREEARKDEREDRKQDNREETKRHKEGTRRNKRSDTTRDEEDRNRGEGKDETVAHDGRKLERENDPFYKSQDLEENVSANHDFSNKRRHKDHLNEIRETPSSQMAQSENNVYRRSDRGQDKREQPNQRSFKKSGDKSVSEITATSVGQHLSGMASQKEFDMVSQKEFDMVSQKEISPVDIFLNSSRTEVDAESSPRFHRRRGGAIAHSGDRDSWMDQRKKAESDVVKTSMIGSRCQEGSQGNIDDRGRGIRKHSEFDIENMQENEQKAIEKEFDNLVKTSKEPDQGSKIEAEQHSVVSSDRSLAKSTHSGKSESEFEMNIIAAPQIGSLVDKPLTFTRESKKSLERGNLVLMPLPVSEHIQDADLSVYRQERPRATEEKQSKVYTEKVKVNKSRFSKGIGNGEVAVTDVSIRKQISVVDTSLNSSIVEDVTGDLDILPANKKKVKNVDKNIEKARSQEDFYKKDHSIKEIKADKRKEIMAISKDEKVKDTQRPVLGIVERREKSISEADISDGENIKSRKPGWYEEKRDESSDHVFEAAVRSRKHDRWHPVRRSRKTLASTDVSDEDGNDTDDEQKVKYDQNDRSRSPKGVSVKIVRDEQLQPARRGRTNVSNVHVLGEEETIVDSAVGKGFRKTDVSSMFRSKSAHDSDDINISETSFRVHEKQKYAGFVKRTGRNVKRSHPMKSVSLTDIGRNEDYQDEKSEEDSQKESRNSRATDRQNDTNSAEDIQDFDSVIRDNPIEVNIDDDDEDRQTHMRKGIFNLLSCVGGKSSGTAWRIRKYKQKRSTAYYEEDEKRKIKKLSRQKDKEEKKFYYFEESEKDTGTSTVADQRVGVMDDDEISRDNTIEEPPATPEVNPSEQLPSIRSSERYKKRATPFQLSKHLSTFADSAQSFDSFGEFSSVDDYNDSHRWDDERMTHLGDESSLSTFSRTKEGEFKTFSSFGKSNISARGSTSVISKLDHRKSPKLENDLVDKDDLEQSTRTNAEETSGVQFTNEETEQLPELKPENVSHKKELMEDWHYRAKGNAHFVPRLSSSPDRSRKRDITTLDVQDIRKHVDSRPPQISKVRLSDDATDLSLSDDPIQMEDFERRMGILSHPTFSVVIDKLDSSDEDPPVSLNTSAPAHFSLDKQQTFGLEHASHPVSDQAYNLHESHQMSSLYDQSTLLDAVDLHNTRHHRTVSFDDGFRPLQRHISETSLGSESTISRPRSTSSASNPLIYEPWRAKANKKMRSMSVSEMYAKGMTRPSRTHFAGEIYNSTVASSVARRRARTLHSGDITSRMYQPRQRSRSHTSLGDTSFGSNRPARQRSFSGFDHSARSSVDWTDSSEREITSESDYQSCDDSDPSVTTVTVKRSESARQPDKSPQIVEELERKIVERSKSDRRQNLREEVVEDKPASPLKLDMIKSTDSASGGETLEERSSKEGSPTKEQPSPTKEKKKKKKFRMPSFSKKKSKESKESAA